MLLREHGFKCKSAYDIPYIAMKWIGAAACLIVAVMAARMYGDLGNEKFGVRGDALISYQLKAFGLSHEQRLSHQWKCNQTAMRSGRLGVQWVSHADKKSHRISAAGHTIRPRHPVVSLARSTACKPVGLGSSSGSEKPVR